MALRFAFSDVANGFVDTIVREMQRPIAKAATAAIREAGAAKRNGRASIAAGGSRGVMSKHLRIRDAR